MSFGVATITIVGNCGSEPEMRFTPNGTQVTNFSVAVNNKRSQNGEEPPPEWFRVAVFGKQAELADQFVSKGARVFVEGRFQTSQWTDQQGALRTALEIVANSFVVFDRSDSQSQAQPAGQAPQKSADPFDDVDLPF